VMVGSHAGLPRCVHFAIVKAVSYHHDRSNISVPRFTNTICVIGAAPDMATITSVSFCSMGMITSTMPSSDNIYVSVAVIYALPGISTGL
jgi:hypothetical protein